MYGPHETSPTARGRLEVESGGERMGQSREAAWGLTDGYVTLKGGRPVGFHGNLNQGAQNTPWINRQFS